MASRASAPMSQSTKMERPSDPTRKKDHSASNIKPGRLTLMAREVAGQRKQMSPPANQKPRSSNGLVIPPTTQQMEKPEGPRIQPRDGSGMQQRAEPPRIMQPPQTQRLESSRATEYMQRGSASQPGPP